MYRDKIEFDWTELGFSLWIAYMQDMLRLNGSKLAVLGCENAYTYTTFFFFILQLT